MSDVDENVQKLEEKIPLSDKIEQVADKEEDESIDNKQENEKDEIDRASAGSPTESVDSSDSDDGEPEEPPDVSTPYPDSKLLIYPMQKMYMCPKCRDLLREPVQNKYCGHYLCYQCYVDVSKLTKRCPMDQVEIGNKPPRVDKEFRDDIWQLEAKCKNNEQGCKWEDTVGKYSEHVTYCEYNSMTCICGTSFPKRFYQRHRDKECGKELIQCEYCESEIYRENKKSHLVECTKLPLPCPNKCDKDLRFPRDELDKHIETECPRTKVVCHFEDIGCSHKSSREKMVKHYAKELTNHVDMLHVEEIKRDELLNKILLKLREHEMMIGNDDERIGNLESINNTQLIWRIEDVSGKMAQAKGGSAESLFHPPFATSKHGYRFSASVCLNGDGKGKGTHMSVFISIHKGDYDVFLKWPFDYRVTFILLDQDEHLNERKHIKYSIKPSPSPENEKFLGRPTMDKNASFGLQKFASHKEIYTRNYIKDNTMLLKISVECPGTDAVFLA
ncbi:TNF receptor-associated factor 4 [Exaiptasia diaphana]|uniref:TNF receptor-associated factor 4 n=1 Tax=Exaiptasia diaphana TaxID=2652724 RepID=A0A913Y3R1_EXADI|nr:TNF receptor-associated factor 4 [Exaiptasia diaphana]KXJ29030.1 TNF receptor-associated factor 4 [Exaiptasia diaphana]